MIIINNYTFQFKMWKITYRNSQIKIEIFLKHNSSLNVYEITKKKSVQKYSKLKREREKRNFYFRSPLIKISMETNSRYMSSFHSSFISESWIFCTLPWQERNLPASSILGTNVRTLMVMLLSGLICGTPFHEFKTVYRTGPAYHIHAPEKINA